LFTGLIETVGRLQRVYPEGGSRRLIVEAPFASELAIGESVAVAGVCQSVIARDHATFTVMAIPETLRRTQLGEYRAGRRVNLERALQLGDRLGGHLVSGHVDGTGRVARIRVQGADHLLYVAFPAEFAALVLAQGSIALDGVSLTVVEAAARQFSVALIPHTRACTTLGDLRVNDRLHLEFDLVGKYLLRFRQVEGVATPGLTDHPWETTGE
jgi:riboflavin synthase